MGSSSFLFQCRNAPCHKCGYATRLPLPIAQVPETNQINSPTANAPLQVVCKACGHLSTYTDEKSFGSADYPDSDLVPNNPFYMVVFECGAENCGAPIRVCKRDVSAYAQKPDILTKNLLAAIGGPNAQCPNGHKLAQSGMKTDMHIVPG